MTAVDLGIDAAVVALDTLRDMVAARTHLSREAAAAIAGAAGVSERTVWNWVAKMRAENPAPEPVADSRNVLQRLDEDGADGFVFDRTAVAMVYAVSGNLRRFHEELSVHFSMPSYETITRRWKELPPLVRDGARRGVKNRFNKCLHLLHSATGPNQVWQLDDFYLDIDVIRPRATKATCRPHLLLLIDDYDRYPVAFAILAQEPTSLDVCCLLAQAIETRLAPDGSGVQLGGIPSLILWDNATVNTADIVSEALESLPGVGRATAPYTPVAKGKVERAGQTLQALIVEGQAGVRTTSESPSKKDLMAARNSDLMTFDALVARAWRVIYEYAHERRHSTLRRTPVAQRARVPYYPRQLSDERLAAMWLAEPDRDKPRVVQPVGVHACGQYWMAPELDVLIGEEVEVRVLHHRRERVAVFHDGRFVCFARPNLNMDPTDRQPVTDGRRAQRQRVYGAAKAARQVQAEAARRAQAGLGDDLVAATIASGAVRGGTQLAVTAAPPAGDDSPKNDDTDPMTAGARLDQPAVDDDRAVSRPVRMTKTPVGRLDRNRGRNADLPVTDRRRASLQRAARSLERQRPEPQP